MPFPLRGRDLLVLLHGLGDDLVQRNLEFFKGSVYLTTCGGVAVFQCQDGWLESLQRGGKRLDRLDRAGDDADVFELPTVEKQRQTAPQYVETRYDVVGRILPGLQNLRADLQNEGTRSQPAPQPRDSR